MKVEITQKGVTGKDGKPVEVGTVLDVEADTVPAHLVNKCRVIEPKAKPDSEPKTKPAAQKAS